jgi:transcriptional regulator NrdR family protein
MSMHCPKCDHPKTDTKDSRLVAGNNIRRRKVCAKCGYQFKTQERIFESYRRKDV